MKPILKTTLTGLCLSLCSLPFWTAHSWAASSWVGKVEQYTLRIDQKNITQIAPQMRILLPALTSMGDEEMPCEAERKVTVKSWVGPVLSFEENNNWNCLGTAHPGAYTEYKTLNLKTGRAIHLTDIFTDQSLLKALLADPIVKKHLPKTHPKLSSSTTLIKYLSQQGTGECAYSFSENNLTNFTFHHVKGSQVAVRIGLSHGCEAARGTLTELGIYLPIPTNWKTYFETARTGKAGFLVENNPVKTISIMQTVKDAHYEAALKSWIEGR